MFAAAYPAIHAHLSQYRGALVKRQDQGEQWWELRACAYWERFAGPKVMYQDITWQPSFCLDTRGTLSNNTVYFLPTGDRWTLAVLNSPISWWFAWRNAQHAKDEALRLFTAFMETFPIPPPTDEQRTKADEIVQRLIDLILAQNSGRREVLDWLRIELAVEKPSQKLQDLPALTPDALVTEVKKARGKKKLLTVVELKRLKEEHTRSIVPLHALAAEVRALEAQVSDLVNAAYGLTPEEVALMWKTAPPRMPGTNRRWSSR